MKLKECPNCGHKKIWVVHGIVKREWFCECFNCHWCGKSSRFKAIAKLLWNRRA